MEIQQIKHENMVIKYRFENEQALNQCCYHEFQLNETQKMHSLIIPEQKSTLFSFKNWQY